MNKECAKCNKVFSRDNFYQFGKDCFCKVCRRAWRKEYYQQNMQRTKNKVKEYDRNNVENLKSRTSKYAKTHKLAYYIYNQLNYILNKIDRLEQ